MANMVRFGVFYNRRQRNILMLIAEMHRRFIENWSDISRLSI